MNPLRRCLSGFLYVHKRGVQMKLQLAKQEGEHVNIVGHIAVEHRLEDLRLLVFQTDADRAEIELIKEQLQKEFEGFEGRYVYFAIPKDEDVSLYHFEVVK